MPLDVTRVDDWVEYSCEDVREDGSCIDQVFVDEFIRPCCLFQGERFNNRGYLFASNRIWSCIGVVGGAHEIIVSL